MAPPSPATNTNGVSVKEKVNSKPLSNGTHDRDVNGEEGQQKSRRSLKLKQGQPTKAPSPEVMIVTSDSIIHKVNCSYGIIIKPSLNFCMINFKGNSIRGG